MKEIRLTQGEIAFVDDEDFEYLNQWEWHTVKYKYTNYARRRPLINGKLTTINMHRQIMKTPINMEVDHIDHNGLNNQKSNLRNCTHRQNAMNNSSRGSSKYLGVSIVGRGRQKGMISAEIKMNYRKIHIGVFSTEIEAAKAYDKKAKELFGEFANLNFKSDQLNTAV